MEGNHEALLLLRFAAAIRIQAAQRGRVARQQVAQAKAQWRPVLGGKRTRKKGKKGQRAQQQGAELHAARGGAVGADAEGPTEAMQGMGAGKDVGAECAALANAIRSDGVWAGRAAWLRKLRAESAYLAAPSKAAEYQRAVDECITAVVQWGVEGRRGDEVQGSYLALMGRARALTRRYRFF